jgi:hypothetical protein
LVVFEVGITAECNYCLRGNIGRNLVYGSLSNTEVAMRLPKINEVFSDLRQARSEISSVTREYVDVRLQVEDDGSWRVHVGDPSYDTDHRGYWGAATISPGDSDGELRDTARGLIAEVKSSYFESK